jgi:hypothetical protein
MKAHALSSESFHHNFYRGVFAAIPVQIAALFTLFDGPQRVKRKAADRRNEAAK